MMVWGNKSAARNYLRGGSYTHGRWVFGASRPLVDITLKLAHFVVEMVLNHCSV